MKKQKQRTWLFEDKPKGTIVSDESTPSADEGGKKNNSTYCYKYLVIYLTSVQQYCSYYTVTYFTGTAELETYCTLFHA